MFDDAGEDDERLMLDSIFPVSFVFADHRHLTQSILRNLPAHHRPNRRSQFTSEAS
jgi:hypothetical protein